MTKEERVDAHKKNFEKNVFTSKKSVLVFMVEVMLFVLALMALRWQPDLGWPLAAFMVCVVFTMGFILLVYIGKQSMVDAFTRGIALGGKAPGAMKQIANKLGISGGDPDDSILEDSE